MIPNPRDQADQCKGGTLTIPDGYVIISIDADADIPTCLICRDHTLEDEHMIEIPRALAYYLNVHHNGSLRLRECIELSAQNTLRSKIRGMLEFSDRVV